MDARKFRRSLISARMPGFSVMERTEMMAPHPNGELEFKGCKVPAEDMIGAPGDGLRLSLQTLDMFRASVGAAACGMARRCARREHFACKVTRAIWPPAIRPSVDSGEAGGHGDRTRRCPSAGLSGRLFERYRRWQLNSRGEPGQNCSPPKPLDASSIRPCRFTAALVWFEALSLSGSIATVRALRIYEGHSENSKTGHRKSTLERVSELVCVLRVISWISFSLDEESIHEITPNKN